jgi:hypothetical protein
VRNAERAQLTGREMLEAGRGDRERIVFHTR